MVAGRSEGTGSPGWYDQGVPPLIAPEKEPVRRPSTAVSALLDALSPDERQAVLTDERLRTLPAAFAAVPDPRQRRGQRYDLPFLLSCLVAALLCNCNALEAVGQWSALQRALLA